MDITPYNFHAYFSIGFAYHIEISPPPVCTASWSDRDRTYLPPFFSWFSVDVVPCIMTILHNGFAEMKMSTMPRLSWLQVIAIDISPTSDGFYFTTLLWETVTTSGKTMPGTTQLLKSASSLIILIIFIVLFASLCYKVSDKKVDCPYLVSTCR